MSQSNLYCEGRGTVGAIREIALINLIKQWLGDAMPPSPEGAGDDCAVVNALPGKQLLTMDPVIAGRHFEESANPQAVGRKLLKRNLSDIAAMGGTPSHAMLGLTLSSNVSVNWLEYFIKGIRDSALQYSVRVVGGDISECPKEGFIAQLAMTGYTESPVLRQGAQNGDSLWVTGLLGGSLLGHHLTFEPRVAEGEWLAKHPEVKAMMDLTDGLAADLPKLLPTGACACLNLGNLPVCAAAHLLAQSSGRNAIEHALCDGEDYELVFALSAAADPVAFQSAWEKAFDTPLNCIGVIQRAESNGLILDADTKKPVQLTGFEHFS